MLRGIITDDVEKMKRPPESGPLVAYCCLFESASKCRKPHKAWAQEIERTADGDRGNVAITDLECACVWVDKADGDVVLIPYIIRVFRGPTIIFSL
jgi:hypothetical protein